MVRLTLARYPTAADRTQSHRPPQLPRDSANTGDDVTVKHLFLTALLLLASCASGSNAATTTSILPTTITTQATTTTSSTSNTTIPPTTTTTTIPRLDRTDAGALGRLHADLDVLLAMGPRVAGSPAEEAAAQHFADQVTAITGSPARVEPFSLPTGGTSWNVWSPEIGSGDRLILIGGHLDSVTGSPGADDNASGVISILELLRRLAEDPPSQIRVVVVGFGAEERIGNLGHHFGSRHAVGVLEDQAALPDLMLSVDMVGLGGQIVCTDFRDGDPGFADELVGVAAGVGVELPRRSLGEISDHVPFARAGVLAAHLWRPDNPHFHQPGDDQVSDEALIENLLLLEALITHLSPPPVPPPPDAGSHQT